MACYRFKLLGLLLTSSLLLSSCLCAEGEASQCHRSAIHRELYRSLYKVISENAISSSEKSSTTVELLDVGTPLAYEDFNPGKPSKFAVPGSLPQSVIEKGLPLVDKIYPTGAYRFRQLSNISASGSTKDYRLDSISSTYDYVLTHMMLLPQNFSDVEVLHAKIYLQELVPNPERVLRDESQLPRFLLYDYYRSNYLNKKEAKENEKDSNRAKLPDSEYQIWGQKRLSILESDTEAAYKKWQTFGYKSDVEKQLQFFEVDVHEDRLMSTRAVFKSMGRPSERDVHATIYPFTLEPADWFKHLKVDLPESSDELRHKKSILKAKMALLNATEKELNSKTSADVNRTLDLIDQSLSNISKMIKNGVDKLLQMEVECFTRVNLTVCGEIANGHNAFRYLLEELAEHYAHAEYLESILNSITPEVIEVIQQEINQVKRDIDVLDAQITVASKDEIKETIDSSTDSDAQVASCPGVGQIKFTFDSENYNTDEYCQELRNDCIDAEIPANVSLRNLWNVHSCSIDSELIAFGTYSDFIELMNSIPLTISASLLKVNVRRSWFDPSVFESDTHFTMKRGSGLVAPGPLTPSFYFQQVAHSGDYLLPHYISAFIVASKVQLFFPGIGFQNYSSYDNQTNEAMKVLMKYAYAQVLGGSVGPFSFELPTGFNHNYQLKQKEGGVMLTLPGGQVIGYIMKAVPKFPHDQSDPVSNVLTQCDELPPTSSPTRRSRSKRSSALEVPSSYASPNMKELAKSLFTEEIGSTLSADHLELIKDSEIVSTQYIEKLLEDGKLKQEQLTKFVSNLDKRRNPAGFANSTIEE